MNLQEMERLIGEAVRDVDLRPEEIPAIDLYLDQITSLAAEKRREGSAHYRDRELTKTMINNYSKDGLISPIKGKKYSKEHIIQMLLVYELKNTLSIGEIKRILQNVYGMESIQEDGLEAVYRRYLDIKEQEREGAWSFLSAYLQEVGLDPAKDADFFTLLLGMASMSAYLKSAVQMLLEARYPDLNEEKTREEQARREEAKRQKEEKRAEAEARRLELKRAEAEAKRAEADAKRAEAEAKRAEARKAEQKKAKNAEKESE